MISFMMLLVLANGSHAVTQNGIGERRAAVVEADGGILLRLRNNETEAAHTLLGFADYNGETVDIGGTSKAESSTKTAGIHAVGGDPLRCTYYQSTFGITFVQVCSKTDSTATAYGNMCIQSEEMDGSTVQDCDRNLCADWGNPTTCCKQPNTYKKIRCSATDFSETPKPSDFANCETECTADGDGVKTDGPGNMAGATMSGGSTVIFVLLGFSLVTRI